MSSQRQHRQNRVVATWLLLCFVFSYALVPQGHMAASFASGAPFHLCPSDAGSAALLDVSRQFLQQQASEPAAHGHHHHGHHAHAVTPRAYPDQDHHHGPGTAGFTAANKPSADSGCAFAGLAGALAGPVLDEAYVALAPASYLTPLPGPRTGRPNWFRPPPRSPPV